VVALVLVLLLKVAAIESLGTFQWLALLLAPLLARGSLVALFITTPYVRSRGIGAALANAPGRACAVSLAITAGLCALAKWRGALALLVAVLVFGLWRHACQRRLGGFTGDTAGALAEMVEAAVLVALAVH
jgi:adenosylcobinamide-GDP ribazoletransferase